MQAIIIAYYTRKEYEKLNECLKFGESRYNVKDNVADGDEDVSKCYVIVSIFVLNKVFHQDWFFQSWRNIIPFIYHLD